jgi:Tfp pilus assembly protein PilF
MEKKSRITQLEEFLKSQPDDSFVLHALALEYIKLGDDTKAEAIFTTLLQKNEKYLGSYYHLAKVYERLHKKEHALQTYEKGLLLATEQKDMHSYQELNNAYMELND